MMGKRYHMSTCIGGTSREARRCRRHEAMRNEVYQEMLVEQDQLVVVAWRSLLPDDESTIWER